MPTLRTGVDFEGGFRFDGLSPGDWRISVGQMSLGGPSTAVVRVGTHDVPEPVVLRLGEGYWVRGLLRTYGTPPGWSAGAIRVVLRTTGEVVGARLGIVGPKDRFEFEDVPAGVYQIDVVSNSGRLWQRQIDVQNDLDLEIEARVASLAGTVRDAAGRPLGDTQVFLFAPERGPGGVEGTPLVSASTGADGRFRIEVLPVGDYVLRLVRNDFLHDAQPLFFAEGDRLDLDLILFPSNDKSSRGR